MRDQDQSRAVAGQALDHCHQLPRVVLDRQPPVVGELHHAAGLAHHVPQPAGQRRVRLETPQHWRERGKPQQPGGRDPRRVPGALGRRDHQLSHTGRGHPRPPIPVDVRHAPQHPPGCRVDQLAAHDPGQHDHDVAGLPRGHAFPFSMSTHRNHGSGRSPSATRRKSEQTSCHGWLVSQIVGRTRQAAGVDPYCAQSGSSAVGFDGQ